MVKGGDGRGSKSQPGGKVGKAMLERRGRDRNNVCAPQCRGQKKECRSMFIPYPQLTWILWRSPWGLWTSFSCGLELRGEIPREVPYLECGSQSWGIFLLLPFSLFTHESQRTISLFLSPWGQQKIFNSGSIYWVPINPVDGVRHWDKTWKRYIQDSQWWKQTPKRDYNKMWGLSW